MSHSRKKAKRYRTKATVIEAEAEEDIEAVAIGDDPVAKQAHVQGRNMRAVAVGKDTPPESLAESRSPVKISSNATIKKSKAQGNTSATSDTNVYFNVTIPSSSSSLPLSQSHLSSQKNDCKSWHLLPSNEHYFVGRKRFLNKLSEHFKLLAENQPVVLSAISGLGGIGKTQLANYYSHHSSQHYQCRIWFHADSQTSLLEDYRQFADEFKLLESADKSSRSDIINAVKQYLEETKNCLVVYDNAGEYHEIKHYLPASNGHVMITTRRQEWHDVGFKIELEKFSEQESIDCLKKRTGEMDETAMRNLAKVLDHLPLALAQAGAYIVKCKITTKDYLDRYNRRRIELLAENLLPIDVDKSSQGVATIWDISLSAILKDEHDKNESKLTLPTLCAIACLDSDGIPRQILEEWLCVANYIKKSSSEETKQHAARDKLDKIVSHLTDYSMIQVDPHTNNIIVHRLVQEIIFTRSVWGGHTQLRNVFLTLNNMVNAKLGSEKESLKKQKLLVSHIGTLIERMSEIIKKERENVSFFKRIMVKINGESSTSPLSMLSQAHSLFAKMHVTIFQGLDIQELYEVSLRTKSTMKLAIQLIKYGSLISPTKIYEELGKNMASYAKACETWNDLLRLNVGVAFYEIYTVDDHTTLLNALEHAFIYLNKKGNQDKRALMVMHAHIALLKRSLGNYKDAERTLKIVIPELLNVYHNDNTNQLVTILRVTLGRIYVETGEYQNGIDQLKQALKVMDDKAPDHPFTLTAYLDLAIAYLGEGQNASCKEICDMVIPKLIKSFFKNAMLENPLIGNIINDYKNNYMQVLQLYRYLSEYGMSFARDLVETALEKTLIINKPKNGEESKSSQLTHTEVYLQSTENILVEKEKCNYEVRLQKRKPVVSFAKQMFLNAYHSSPLNFSFVSGIRYIGLPYLKGSRFLGRLSALNSKNGLFEDIKLAGEMAAKNPRGACYFWLGLQPVILITKPNDIRQVLKFNNHVATRNKPFKYFGQLLGKENIFLENRAEAEVQRKFLKGRLFSEESANHIHKIIQAQIKTLVDKRVNIRDFFNQLAMTIFAKTQLGIPDIPDNVINELSQCILKAFEASTDLRHLVTGAVKHFVGKPSSIITLGKELRHLFKKHLIRLHQGDILNSDNMIKDIVLELSQKLGRPLSDLTDDAIYETIYSKACTLLIAGHETTSALFQFIVILLAKHPTVLKKLKLELGNMKDQAFAVSNVDKLSYLRAIIKEALRLYTPPGIIPRGAEQKFRLVDQEVLTEDEYTELIKNKKRSTSSDIHISQGDIILISPYITHRLDSTWDDPEKFIPERHLSDKKKDIGPIEDNYDYIAFGAGEQRCIGWKFAERELMQFLSMVYFYYDIVVETNCDSPTIEIEWIGTIKPKPLFISFVYNPLTKNYSCSSSDFSNSFQSESENEEEKETINATQFSPKVILTNNRESFPGVLSSASSSSSLNRNPFCDEKESTSKSSSSSTFITSSLLKSDKPKKRASSQLSAPQDEEKNVKPFFLSSPPKQKKQKEATQSVPSTETTHSTKKRLRVTELDFSKTVNLTRASAADEIAVTALTKRARVKAKELQSKKKGIHVTAVDNDTSSSLADTVFKKRR